MGLGEAHLQEEREALSEPIGFGFAYNIVMNKYPLAKLLRFTAIFGNVYFAYWILYKAIDEGLPGNWYEIALGTGLFLLLSLNTVLLWLSRDRPET